MKKFPLLFLFCCVASIAQNTVSRIPIRLTKPRDAFQVTNSKTQEVVLFLSDKSSVSGIRLDENIEFRDSLRGVYPGKAFKTIVGTNEFANGYRIFWKKDDDSYSAQEFDFTAHSVSVKDFAISTKGENVFDHFSDNGNFYLISLSKRADILTIYRVDQAGSVSQKQIDLTGTRFLNTENRKMSLRDIFAEFQPAFINDENPTPLTKSRSKVKSYAENGMYRFTVDISRDFTHIVTIDLANLTSSVNHLRKPKAVLANLRDASANSFIADDKVFQFKLTENKVDVVVKDFEDKTLKEYSIEKDKPVPFENAEIVQEKRESDNARVLEKSNQLIRKMFWSQPAMSVYKSGENYLVTLGCITEQTQTVGQAALGSFGVAGAIAASFIYRSSYSDLNSYSRRRVVYLNFLLDKNGETVNTKLPALAFDKMRKFSEQNEDISSTVLFKKGNSFYLGYFHPQTKSYNITEYQDAN